MSGGSYDYAFRYVDEMADSLHGVNTDPLRRAFAAHLRLVAKAMRDVEWQDSCDGADWQTSVKAVLHPGAVETATKDALLDVAKSVIRVLEGAA